MLVARGIGILLSLWAQHTGKWKIYKINKLWQRETTKNFRVGEGTQGSDNHPDDTSWYIG